MAGIAEIYSHFYYLIAKIDNLEPDSPEIFNFELNDNYSKALYNTRGSVGVKE